jgi:hypothetical protein
MLNLLDFSRLNNDPISHDPSWMTIASKLPSYILKFDGNPEEEPSTHIMTYHLWFSSNSLMDDSVRLHIFHRSLTRVSTKWYIELKGNSFKRFNNLAMEFLFNDMEMAFLFNDLAMEFLMHHQFPIRYKIRTDLLTSLRQYNATHIFDHIHEWQ